REGRQANKARNGCTHAGTYRTECAGILSARKPRRRALHNECSRQENGKEQQGYTRKLALQFRSAHLRLLRCLAQGHDAVVTVNRHHGKSIRGCANLQVALESGISQRLAVSTFAEDSPKVITVRGL